MNELDFSEIAKLSERYNNDPKSRIFVQLADAYRKNNMIDEALEVLNKGLVYHPEYPLAFLILGKCHFDKRNYVQAKESFKKTISLDPQNIVALRMLAQTFELLKDEDGQVNAYKNIIALDPLDTITKEKLQKLEALRKKEPLYTMSMAEEYEKQGDVANALNIYEHLLFTDPSDLLLQQKVKDLKQTIAQEDKKSKEEKIQGLQLETYFKPSDLETKDKSDLLKTLERAEAEIVEPAKSEEEEPKEEEEIMSLEDFLIEEKESTAEEISATQPEEMDRTSATTEEGTEVASISESPEIDEKLQYEEDAEKTQIQEMTKSDAEQKRFEPPVAEQAATQEADLSKTEEISPPEAEQIPVEKKPTPTEKEAEEEKKEESKKLKEEDYKSFQEWLSGLLK